MLSEQLGVGRISPAHALRLFGVGLRLVTRIQNFSANADGIVEVRSHILRGEHWQDSASAL